MFGAIGDGITNDFEAIKKCFSYSNVIINFGFNISNCLYMYSLQWLEHVFRFFLSKKHSYIFSMYVAKVL